MMRNEEMRRYAAYVKAHSRFDVSEELLEKDYMVSLFLQTFRDLLAKGDLSRSAGKICFKGGTLLTKTALEYHRMSEDVDLTYSDAHLFRKETRTKPRERLIKPVAHEFLDDIRQVATTAGFASPTDNDIQIRNSRAVYVIQCKYESAFAGEGSLKIECNFLEDLQQTPEETRLTLVPEALGLDMEYLRSIGYDLEPITMRSYTIPEVILEKFRAILTRKDFKDRDAFDLYLLHEKGYKVLQTNKDLVLRKVKAGDMINQNSEKNLKERCASLASGFDSTEDVSLLSLKKVDWDKYGQFLDDLLEVLKDVCKRTAQPTPPGA
ncbi:MAG: nucleotidyl transferase AbiEii/AbiGii toxin family protein [Candidatus Woesearchaeota archaeon]